MRTLLLVVGLLIVIGFLSPDNPDPAPPVDTVTTAVTPTTSPTTTPEPTPEVTEAPSTSSYVDVPDMDVDRPHRDRESRFCRRRWWC